ncbi:MAG: alpha/beta hydrolase [Alphaproteobacteria bacterium]|nr:alpha/beta hydrolase [Alphaproteobacteria bacterium]
MHAAIASAALLFLMAAISAVAKPYVVPHTEVVALHSRLTGADYELFVATPAGYRKSGKSYPVVYMLDADYSFALTRNVVQHFVEREDLPEMILVAIAYPGAAADREVYKMNRTRDYTPVYAPDGGYGAEYQKVSGGGAKFRAFIATELVPFIDKRFPTALGDRTLIGHSYGGLFATYVLLTEPKLFKRYIIVSPSLWYAKRIAFTMEERAARDGITPNTRVFFAVGALEQSMMADDLQAMVKNLRRRNIPQLQIGAKVFEGERHNSVFPGAVTRGLLTVFDRPAPSKSMPQPDRAN